MTLVVGKGLGIHPLVVAGVAARAVKVHTAILSELLLVAFLHLTCVTRVIVMWAFKFHHRLSVIKLSMMHGLLKFWLGDHSWAGSLLRELVHVLPHHLGQRRRLLSCLSNFRFIFLRRDYLLLSTVLYFWCWVYVLTWSLHQNLVIDLFLRNLYGWGVNSIEKGDRCCCIRQIFLATRFVKIDVIISDIRDYLDLLYFRITIKLFYFCLSLLYWHHLYYFLVLVIIGKLILLKIDVNRLGQGLGSPLGLNLLRESLEDSGQNLLRLFRLASGGQDVFVLLILAGLVHTVV